MTDAEILHRLSAVFAQVLARPSLVLDPAWTAADVDGWDSLRHVQVILRTEAAFGIRLAPSDLAGLRSVADLVAAIGRRGTG